ncbi:hypothetical protein KAF56_26175, partial [Klebsiella pneumoniae]|nr:hypothetical protein [Klebsiella pneumoniae]
LCHGTVCVVGKMRDLILQLSKSSIYSTKPPQTHVTSSGASMPQSGIQKTGCALLASPDLMFSSGATVPDETRFRLRYIQLPKQRKKLPSESDRKISTFGVVRLGGAGVSQAKR